MAMLEEKYPQSVEDSIFEILWNKMFKWDYTLGN